MPKAPEHQLNLAQANAMVDELGGLIDRYQARFILALVATNAAGLTLLGGKVIDVLLKGPTSTDAASGAATIALVLPSLWMFVIGASAAGLAHLCEHVEFWHTHAEMRRRQAELQKAGPNAFLILDDPETGWWETTKAWFLEVLSGVMFLGGLSYPLVVLASRYFRNGGVLIP